MGLNYYMTMVFAGWLGGLVWDTTVTRPRFMLAGWMVVCELTNTLPWSMLSGLGGGVRQHNY